MKYSEIHDETNRLLDGMERVSDKFVGWIPYVFSDDDEDPNHTMAIRILKMLRDNLKNLLD